MADWRKVADFIGKAAPVLGTVVGGPIGTAAGGVVSALCGLFGADPADPGDLLAKMTADSDAYLKLKEFELAHKTELEKIALERDRLHFQDIADARGREMEIAKVTGKRDIFQYGLAAVVIFGFIGCIAAVLFAGTKVETAIAGTLIGYISAKADQIIVYFFGSSKGSAEKTALLIGRK